MAELPPVRILSFDGGGIRGLASLIMLEEIMAQIERQRKAQGLPGPIKPYQCFDLICGNSTGGLIALMLGRLQYGVKETIKEYRELSEKIFTSKSKSDMAKFDEKVYEDVIRDVISKAPGNPDVESLLEDTRDFNTGEACRVFVVSKALNGAGSQTIRLRTYGTASDNPFEATIWQAARATSAAPTFFESVEIDETSYSDGGTGCNNPTEEALNEAREVFENRRIGCVVSLGTGVEEAAQLQTLSGPVSDRWGDWAFHKVAPSAAFKVSVGKYLAECITSCEVVHQRIARSARHSGISGCYFRLNPPGAGSIPFDEWKRLKEVKNIVKVYTNNHEFRVLKPAIAKLLVNPITANANNAQGILAQGFQDTLATTENVPVADKSSDEPSPKIFTPGQKVLQPVHIDKKLAMAVMQQLEKREDPNAKRDDGWTPLHEAVCQKNRQTVRLLLENGADPNIKRNDGWTILREAVKKGDKSIVKLLLDYGADPKAGANDGWTALHEAAYYTDEPIARLLLENEADPNAMRDDKWTVLCEAVQKGDRPIVQLLIDARANVGQREQREARCQQNKSILQLLQSVPLPEGSSLSPRFNLFDDELGGLEPDISTRLSDEWFMDFENHVLVLLDDPEDSNGKRVKVAILDTGFDGKDPAIRANLERVKGMRSWVEGGKADEDLAGHGTHTLALLLKVAPDSDIFVARIAKNNDLVNHDDVKNAIRWAANDCDADIITMSFGFPVRIDSIHKAIQEAHSRDKIMFAAASNHGGNHGIAYPANDLSRIIAINSTDGLGNSSTFNPTPHPRSENFATLGETVESSWPVQLGFGYTQRKSGTSFATPIAAGIAAVILQYVMQKVPADKFAEASRLRSCEGMKAVLKLMAEERNGYHYIAPWKFLSSEKGHSYIRENILNVLKEI